MVRCVRCRAVHVPSSHVRADEDRAVQFCAMGTFEAHARSVVLIYVLFLHGRRPQKQRNSCGWIGTAQDAFAAALCRTWHVGPRVAAVPLPGGQCLVQTRLDCGVNTDCTAECGGLSWGAHRGASTAWRQLPRVLPSSPGIQRACSHV